MANLFTMTLLVAGLPLVLVRSASVVALCPSIGTRPSGASAACFCWAGC